MMSIPLPRLRLGATIVLAALLAGPARAEDPDSTVGAEYGYVPVYHPELTIGRAPGAIEVDAHFDDPGWRGAAVANNFAEHSPGDQTKPEVDTEVKITYDENNLYIAWFCYDDPSEVRVGQYI